jgi:hypothetical protein
VLGRAGAVVEGGVLRIDRWLGWWVDAGLLVGRRRAGMLFGGKARCEDDDLLARGRKSQRRAGRLRMCGGL